ncbi:hypothetical protein [Pedobacter sp. SYSU D00535]|uniref:hypothetical protein n=1 Tax=Pedobacter sp. SYSU D00535 TaxID=2810308 RepID=UPI001A95B348|nr:hypothetical protein [Pedobacter sp. SYSU D00535]
MRDEIENLPVYQKAKELMILAEHISEFFKDDEQREELKAQILSNAMLIVIKIAGAEAAELYTMKMENALRIKFAVKELFDAVLFARIIKINNNDYVQLVRNTIEEFRQEFVKWIRTFDIEADFKDDWGIRFAIDLSDDYEVKMVQAEGKDFDFDNSDFDWGFDEEE